MSYSWRVCTLTARGDTPGHLPEKVPEKTPGAWFTKLSMTAPGLRGLVSGSAGGRLRVGGSEKWGYPGRGTWGWHQRGQGGNSPSADGGGGT